MQPVDVWEDLQTQGELLVQSEHPHFSGNSHLFMRPAYDWMRQQMALRLPNYQGHYPWWAHNFCLDLRRWRWHTSSSSEWFVRIELNIPTQHVLLSSYSAWDCVLSRAYLPAAVEWEDYERAIDQWWAELEQAGIEVQIGIKTPCVPYPEPWESRMKTSWERIFDVEARQSSDIIQATFEKLQLADVVKVTKFRSERGRIASKF